MSTIVSTPQSMDPPANVVDMLMLLTNEVLANRHQINDLRNEIIELSKKSQEDCRMLRLVQTELLLAKEDVRKTRQAMLSFAMESELHAWPRCDAEFE